MSQAKKVPVEVKPVQPKPAKPKVYVHPLEKYAANRWRYPD